MARRRGERRRIGSRLDDGDAVGGDAVVAPARAAVARLVTTTRARRSEGAAFADLERGGRRGIEPGLRGERMMHERDDAQPRALRARPRPAARRAPGRRPAPARRRESRPSACAALRARRRRRARKTVVERDDVDGPSAVAQAGDDPAVVAVAAGARLEIARDHDVQRSRTRELEPFSTSRPVERRRGDVRFVQRHAHALDAARGRRRDRRGRSPPRSASKISCARNSVVVLRPCERRLLVEVAIVQRGERRLQHLAGAGRCRRPCRWRRARRAGTPDRPRRWRRAAAAPGRTPRRESCGRS